MGDTLDAYAFFSTLDRASAVRIEPLVRFVAVTVGGFGGFAAFSATDEGNLRETVDQIAALVPHTIDVVISVEQQAEQQVEDTTGQEIPDDDDDANGPSWLVKKAAVGESIVTCAAATRDQVVSWLRAQPAFAADPQQLAYARVPDANTLLVEYTCDSLTDVNQFFLDLQAQPQVVAMRTATAVQGIGY